MQRSCGRLQCIIRARVFVVMVWTELHRECWRAITKIPFFPYCPSSSRDRSICFFNIYLCHLYILDISSLSDVGLIKVFPHSGCHFMQMALSFPLQKFVQLHELNIHDDPFSIDRSISILLHVNTQLDQKYLLKMLSFSIVCF